jgi:hypothetical protein
LIIERSEARAINDNPGWSMAFGRRKVGKTFMMERFVRHDVFCFVGVDLSVHARGLPLPIFPDLDMFADAVVHALNRGLTCIVDEFQRLPLTTLEVISKAHPNGRLILTGSGMRTTLRMMGRNSPMLALLLPFKIGLVKPMDVLGSLHRSLGAETALGLSPLLRDPWTVPYYKEAGFIESLVISMRHMIPAFVGEVFTDDERELTQVYAAILSLIGAGKTDHWEIAQTLHSRGIIRTGASANVLPFMNNMVEIGLLEKVRAYGKRSHIYTIPSFPVRLFYYLDSRYGLSGRDISYDEVRPTVEAQLRLGIEDFLADLFAERLGGRKELIKEPDREIDLLITVRNRPKLVGEVKWGRATKADVSRFLGKVEGLRCRKVLVTREPVDTDEVEVMIPVDVVRLATGEGGTDEGRRRTGSKARGRIGRAGRSKGGRR